MTFVSSAHYEVRCVPTAGTAAESLCADGAIFDDVQTARMLPTIATRSYVVDRLGPRAGEFLDSEAQRLAGSEYVVELRRWSTFNYDPTLYPVGAVRNIVYTAEVVPGPMSEALLDALAPHEYDPTINARVRYIRRTEAGPIYHSQDVTAAIDDLTEDMARKPRS